MRVIKSRNLRLTTVFFGVCITAICVFYLSPSGIAADIGSLQVQPACDGGSFAPPVNFGVGALAPRSVTTGDFDADGKLDLATANLSSDSVSILLANGLGGFAAATTFGTGDLPTLVTTGDFNTDGKLDLATANFGSANVSLLLGDGLGGFLPATNFAVGAFPDSVTTGDFNADGKLDLATADSQDGTVSLLLGDGLGGFAAATPFAVGYIPQSVTTGDFDADGNLDLVTVNSGVANISVLLGDGSGGFTAATNFGTGQISFFVTTGDFNVDGKLDLATANVSSDSVSLLLGDGLGGFLPATDFAVGDFPQSITTGDFNADGKLDLATANRTSANVSLLLGDGFGGFLPATHFAVGPSTQSVTMGDFNADGKLDLAAANGGIGRVSILFNQCALTCPALSFGTATNFATGTSPRSVAVGDFNSDGKLDLGVANFDTDNVSLLLGNGTGSFAEAVDFAAGDAPRGVVAGDFDSDGKLDLAVANFSSDNVSLLRGNGTGGFAAPVDFAVGDAPRFVVTGDFNSDGKVDLVTANFGSSNVSLLRGDGSGGFAVAVAFAVGDAPRAVATGDFNSDGKLDLAVTTTFSNTLVVLFGNGTGSFAVAVNFGAENPIGVTTGDFNSDGNLDLATGNNAGTVSILLGDGIGGFAPAVNVAAGDRRLGITAGDFNLDGKVDLAMPNFDSGTVSVTQGGGLGGFAAPLNMAAGAGTTSVTAGDFNADGKLDLVVANSNAANVSVLLNNSCTSNTAPVSNNDPYSTNEDTALNVPSLGVLGNDTDGDGNSLTAALVSGPSNALSFTLNPDGSFSYTPNENFNGVDSFTYKANDGSLDSNVATVTITVNSVNDVPVVTATPSTQTVHYSDQIAEVIFNVSDVDSENLNFSTQFKVGAGSFVPGLPSGLSVGTPTCTTFASGQSCNIPVGGTVDVASGVYVIRFIVSDMGDGSLPQIVDHTLTVTKEKTETVYTGDVFMFTAGPTVTTANVRLSAQLTQQADGNPGDITKAKVSFLLFKSSNLGATPDLIVSGVPVEASGAALKFVNLGVDTWTIKVKIDADNGYWKASPVGMGTITVEQPTNELRTSGGGWVADAESMNGKGNFGFNVANQKKGVRGGSVYLFRGLDGFNYLVKSTSWQNGGIGFGSEGAILSKAAFSGKCVIQKIDPETGDIVESFGNYSFTVDVRDGDLFNPRQSDKYAITVLNSNGLVWRQIGSRTNPPAIGGGNITVKAK